MSRESSKIRALCNQLIKAKREPFPLAGTPLNVTNRHGVYVIFGPKGIVRHVGRTVRGQHGLRQRLNDHLHGSSSFTQKAFKGKGARLRGTHRFSFLEVSDRRTRALLEALAIGMLCPQHLGLGEKVLRA